MVEYCLDKVCFVRTLSLLYMSTSLVSTQTSFKYSACLDYISCRRQSPIVSPLISISRLLNSLTTYPVL